jgi:chromosome condensin MukBEF ATPase and DNA-binding subunit MukB
MASNPIADLKRRLDGVVADRTELEENLQKEQAKLRKLDRQEQHAEYTAQLQIVNGIKSDIARISVEHVEVASAVALVSGGTNHRPPPITPGT